MARELKNLYIPFLFAIAFLFSLDVSFTFSSFIQSYFESLHLLMEIISVFIAFSIAMQGLTFYKPYASYKIIVFSSVFFTVGIMDLFHALTYEGLPLFGERFTQPSIWFTLLGRMVEAASILTLILLPEKKSKNRAVRQFSFTLVLLSTILITIVISTYSTAFPNLYNSGSFTLIKLILEIIYCLIHIFVLTIIIRAYRRNKRKEGLLVGISSMFLILSSFMMIILGASGDIYGPYILSHFFKIIGYFYYFKAVFLLMSKQPYEKVAELSSNYSRLLNSVVEGIFGIDQSGKVMFINDSACRMLGFRENELIGRTIHKYIHHSIQDESSSLLFTSPDMEEKTMFSVDQWFWRKDGSRFPVEYFTRPIIENGVIVGTVVTFLDVSERKKLEQLQTEQANIEYELEIAASVQETLFSTIEEPQTVDMGFISKSFKKLNGDFYNVIQHNEEILFAIADVCGKGIPAAIQMTMLKFAMESHSDPEKILNKINSYFTKFVYDSSFITMFVGQFNQQNSKFLFSSAGHEPGLHYKPAEDAFIELTTGNPLLGIDSNIKYHRGSITLEKGDLLLFYTDGIIERRNRAIDSNEFIKNFIREMDLNLPAQKFTELLYEKIMDFHQGKVEDDQTILLFKI
ncbi:SpoIIE family protein phosphatase [Falsibacillus pallidus]|uniref:PAS domain S-box-containing protein n=1 Tax=Falsibacillus pallidus TaxID=493781 RepID=A0A370GDT4_9BACI|nr:SpoIIE family protein phosphatase [Falsibacillus pallidus]RDI41386.1 PAS domain S-box-containing protein [Falsibacillus pallidus]